MNTITRYIAMPGSGQYINWVGFRTLMMREITRFLSVYRQTVIPGLITSALYIIIFGLTLQRRISAIDGISYTVYILPGLVMMNVITNAYSNTSSSLLQMKLLQQLQDLLITPLSTLELSLSFIIGGLVRGFINGILVMLLGVLIVGMPVEHPGYALLFLLLVSAAFSSAGLILGILAESWDNIATMVNFLIMPLIFLGGVFYSINMLPGIWRTLSMMNPIYYVINGLRYSVLGVGDSPFWIALTAALMMTVLFSTAAVVLFHKGYRIKN
ncbi:MAG: ABC transporter permease [Fidelibacterota bacterium]